MVMDDELGRDVGIFKAALSVPDIVPNLQISEVVFQSFERYHLSDGYKGALANIAAQTDVSILTFQFAQYTIEK